MGRVETRLYKRKLRRSKTIRAAVLICLLGAAAWLAWTRLPGGFITEMIALPTATPMTSAYDQTVETREVTLPEETWFAIQTGVVSVVVQIDKLSILVSLLFSRLVLGERLSARARVGLVLLVAGTALMAAFP